jgi:hypothetical protein
MVGFIKCECSCMEFLLDGLNHVCTYTLQNILTQKLE